MVFEISLGNGTINYHLRVELLETGPSFEKFKVFPPANPDKFIVIQNDRPLIRKKYHLKHKPLTWTLVVGSVKDNQNYQRLLKKIGEVLEPPEVKKRKSSGYFEEKVIINRKKRPSETRTLAERKKPGE